MKSRLIVSFLVCYIFVTISGFAACAPPSIQGNPQSRTVCSGAFASFCVSAGGTTPLGYQWFKDQTLIVGAVTNCYSVTNSQATDVGGYTVVVSNRCGMITSTPAFLVVTQCSLSVNCSADKVITCSNAWNFDPPTVLAPCCGTNVAIFAVNTVTNGNDCAQTITRTWQIIDCCSNSMMCTQTVSVLAPVVVLSQPTNTTIQEGSMLNWGVAAAGGNVQLQWFHEGTPVANATNATFNITNALPGDGGAWSIHLGNLLSATNITWYLIVNPCINVQCPESMFVQACDAVPVYYSATASETCFGNPSVTFIPPSGSPFPVGATPVQCIATDDQGHSNSCIFTVTVVCPGGDCCSNSIWQPFAVASRPVARREHAMAWDDATGNVVLFGGYDVSGKQLNDTWIWDGSDWQQVFPVNSPNPRFGHEMAYDAARQVVVLYGGFSGNSPNGETWEWDGGNWTQRTPANSPAPRFRHSMAYDPNTHFVMLYGGTASGGPQGDTWEWNASANTWNQVAFTGNGPSARHSAGMATDPIRQRVVLFGGWPQNSETWEWNGGGWIQSSPYGPVPASRYEHAMAFSPGCGNVLLFGGWSDSLGALADTWNWNGYAWSQGTSGGPLPRQYPKLALNSDNNSVTLFGGFTTNSAFDSTWEWSCECPYQAEPSDTNDFPILPAGLTTNDVDIVDVSNRLGNLQELYPEFDTSLATWYTNLHCPQSLGGTVPDDVTNDDGSAALLEIGISNVTPAEISMSVSNWTVAISSVANATNDDTLATAPAVGPPFYPPEHPHCVDPSYQYAFGGRDIIFVHGLKLDHIRDKIVHVPGADAMWNTTTQFPADTVNPQFYNSDGYFKMIAQCNWDLKTNGVPLMINGQPAEGHITRFLADHHYMNRYIYVAYPCTEPLSVAVQAVLTQISDAMHFGTGVVDPTGHNDTNNFGTPSFVIVAHSTGNLVSDVALSAAVLHPNLNADYIPRYCKGFISYDAIFSGSDLATVAMALAGFVSDLPNVTKSWFCPYANIALHGLGNTFPCSGVPGEYDWGCGGTIDAINASILLDLVPPVTQHRWGPYERQAPVRILTVCGGHPSALKPLKHMIMPGFDDGVTTIDSQVGNPNLWKNWPSTFVPKSLLWPNADVYDKGVAKALESPHRARGYWKDQVQEGGLGRVASGATPYISPSGMRQPVFIDDDQLHPEFNPWNRYTNHFSFLQSASDHFGGYNGNPAFGGFNPLGPYYQDTKFNPNFEDFYLEFNWEESNVIFDNRVYENYQMPYPGDDAPLIGKGCMPENDVWMRGKYWKLRKRGKKHWLWFRYYDLLPNSYDKMGCNYVYESVLCSSTNRCPVCVAPPADAALWLPFDEDSGSTAHNLAGGSDGVLYNGLSVASGVNGPAHVSAYAGRGLCFDGVDDDVEVPSYKAIDVLYNDFTIAAWVKPATNGGAHILVEKRDGAGDGYSLWMNNGSLVLTLGDPNGSANYLDTGKVPADGLWHFVVVSVVRSWNLGIRFYIDGYATSVQDPTARSGSLGNAAPFRIGRSGLINGISWAGCIDEVQMFSRALGTAEINTLVQARWAGACEVSSYVPPYTGLCISQTSTTNFARLCNHSTTTQTLNYHFEDCSTAGHLSFNPAAGVVVVPPGACTNIPVVIGVNGCCQFCYTLAAQALESGATPSASGQISYSDVPCNGWNGNGQAQVSSAAASVLPSFRFANGTGVTQTYYYRFGILDQTGAFDATHISLNGLPPGLFVTGTATLAPGAATNIFLTAQFVMPDPLGQYSVVLQMDPTGTGAWQSISALGLNSVTLPSLSPPLTMTVSGGNLILSWNTDGTCHLQTASHVANGTNVWTDVPGLSPIALPISVTNQFFRLKCP